MKLLLNLRNRYRTESRLIQEKAVSLFILNSLLCFGFLSLGVLRLSGGVLLLGG